MTVARWKGFIIERDASGVVTNLVRAKAITLVTQRPNIVTNDLKELENVVVWCGSASVNMTCSANHMWSLLRADDE